MKRKIYKTVGVILLVLFVFLTYFFLTRFRSSGLLSPIFGENHKAKLIQELLVRGISLNTPPNESDDTLVASISASQIYFSKEKDLSAQVVALQIILGKITIDDRIPKEIDLRFNKPILRY